MSPRLSRLLALFIPLACAVVFVRLGFWQLERGRQRSAINAGLEARLGQAPVAFGSLPADTTAQRWQRVTLHGRWRYDLEQVQAARTNAGSPGVHLLTPFERLDADGLPLADTLVVVTRGWVYSPDAASVQLGRWRERRDEALDLQGYVLPLPLSGSPAPADTSLPLRVVHREALEARIGRPVAPVLVVMTSDSTARADSVPRRLAMPVIDPGPHRSYAIQWFAFALIAVVGGVALARRTAVG